MKKLISDRHTRARAGRRAKVGGEFWGTVFDKYGPELAVTAVPTAAGGCNVGFKCPHCGQLVAEYLTDEDGQVLPDRPVFDWTREHLDLWF